MADHVSRFTAMRLLAQELPASDAARVEAHAARCAPCGALMGELRETQRRGEIEAPALRAPAPPAPRAWLSSWRFPAVAATSLAAALFLLALPRSEPIRAKGGLRLEVSCKLGERLWRCARGERLAPGTALQLEIELARDGYLAILGRDGSGAWSTYLPQSGDEAVRVARSNRRPLANSLVLDSAPGPERFFAVAAPGPFRIGEVLTKQARDAGRPEVPAGGALAEIEFAK